MSKLLYILVIVSTLVLTVSCKSKMTQPTSQTYTSAVIKSKILNENRKILISVPKFKYSEKFGPIEYPVIYVLDGEDMFHFTSSIVNFLSGIKGNRMLPPSVVIGVVNTDRNKDFTHDKIQSIAKSGKGDHFTKFMKEELFKYVEQHYPTKNHRTLIGHSFGGLFALHTLINHPQMFDNYIALDPSFQYMEKKELNFSSSRYKNKQLYIGIANTFDVNETQENNYHYNSLINLCEELNANQESMLALSCEIFEDDNHASLCIDATHDALRNQFSWFHFNTSQNNINELTQIQLDSLLANYKEILSTQYKEDSQVSELLINQIAQRVKNDKVKFKFLKDNLDNNPKSFNAHFSLGQYYATLGKTDSARYYVEKAIKIHPDEWAKKELEKWVK